MNFKKISMFFLMFIIALTSANAITELNSCGKNSGWVTGETYNITFNEIPVTYTGTYCFYISEVDKSNISFISTSEEIIINSANLNKFFHYYNGADNLGGTYENFNIDIDNGQDFSFIYSDFLYAAGSGIYYMYFTDTNFNNITIKSNYLTENVLISNNIRASGDRNQRIIYTGSNFNDIKLIDTYFIINRITNSNNDDTRLYMNNFEINNLFYDFKNSVYGLGENDFTSQTYFYFYLTDWVVNNSILIMDNTNLPFSNIFSTGISSNEYYSGNIIQSSLISNKINVDVNDDNVGDTTSSNWDSTNFIINNPSIYVINNNDYYIQDVAEAFDLLINTNDINVYPINNEYITFTTPADFGTGDNIVFNCEYISQLNASALSFIMDYSSTLINCNINNPSDSILGAYQPVISISSDSIIKNINYEHSGTQNSNIISTDDSKVSTYSFLFSSNLWVSDNTQTGLSYFRSKALYGNVVLNTNFSVTGDSIVYYLDFPVLTTVPSTTITKNIFENPSSYNNVYLFRDNSNNVDNIKFYNNKIYDNQNLKIGDSSINLNTIYGYEHTDNKIYFFNIGNYYVGNIGCVDSDINGICDSSYTFDGVVDNYPLSSYPFDFVSHLLTADYVVDNDAFNVSFVGVIDYEQIELTTLSDTIIVDYQHDSSFVDLQCDYIVNALGVATSTNVPNTLQNFSHNNWGEGINTIFINCQNIYRSATTGVYHLNISLFVAPVLGCIDINATNYNPLATQDDSSCFYPGDTVIVSGNDIINFDSISETNENAGTFLSNIGGFIISVGTPIAIVVTIIVLGMAVVRFIF